MDLTILFVLYLLAMLVAWRGRRSFAGAMFGIALALSVADYFHHASDALKLSF